MKMSFRACHASRLQSCWRGTRKDSTLCFLLALLSFGCLHISSALLRVWQWYLSGAVALLVHTQCTLRYEGGKWSPWQLEGLCGPLSARTSLSANTKMLLTDNFHKLLCWVSASLYSMLSHASSDTCGRTCWYSMACLSVALSAFSFQENPYGPNWSQFIRFVLDA